MIRVLFLGAMLGLAGCQSTRGLIVSPDGTTHAYETSQWPWVMGEFHATAGDGASTATLGVDHSVIGSLGLAGIGVGAAAVSGGVLP